MSEQLGEILDVEARALLLVCWYVVVTEYFDRVLPGYWREPDEWIVAPWARGLSLRYARSRWEEAQRFAHFIEVPFDTLAEIKTKQLPTYEQAQEMLREAKASGKPLMRWEVIE